MGTAITASQPFPWTEFIDHAHDALIYVAALSWTHAIMPTVGGPTLVSIPELMLHRFGGPYLVFVWIYTMGMTGFCFWIFRLASERAAAISANTDLVHVVLAAVLDSISKSMAWIAAWAWMVALLGSLPTAEPLEALFSAALVTIAAAAALLAGQRGRGPFAKALDVGRGRGTEELKWLIFCASWMTAVAWIGALTACVGAIGIPPVVAAWVVAAGTLCARWAWLRAGDPPSDAAAWRGLQIYAASPDAALTVGLMAAQAPPLPSEGRAAGDHTHTAAASASRTGGATRAVPPLAPAAELRDASLGLSALAGAWLGCVAVQGASSALWASSLWPVAGTAAAALVDVLYALALSAAAVAAVATARAEHAAEAAAAAASGAALEEARALRRFASLAGETAALAVAAGWAWYNALAAWVPPLTSRGLLVRLAAAAVVTSSAVVCTLALKRARRAYEERQASADSPSGSEPPANEQAGGYSPPRA